MAEARKRGRPKKPKTLKKRVCFEKFVNLMKRRINNEVSIKEMARVLEVDIREVKRLIQFVEDGGAYTEEWFYHEGDKTAQEYERKKFVRKAQEQRIKSMAANVSDIQAMMGIK